MRDGLVYKPNRAPHPTTRALVLLDSSPIRAKAAKACARARKDYTSLAADWERYKTQDAPAFSRALALSAGTLREEMCGLLPKYQELASLLDAVADEVFFSGDDPSVCLARIEAGAEEPDAPDSDDADCAADEPPTEEPDDDEENETDDDVDIDELLHRVMDQMPKGAPAKREDANACRMKELYRELVRALHPDQGGHLTPERMHLWHEVQAAYRKRDLARMEFLHAKSGMATDLGSPTTPVSRIMSITALFKKSLRDLRHQIRTAIADPAWGFTALSDKERKAVLWKTETVLRKDVNRMKLRISELEAQLEEIRNPSQRPQRRKRRGWQVLADDDRFDLFD